MPQACGAIDLIRRASPPPQRNLDLGDVHANLPGELERPGIRIRQRSGPDAAGAAGDDTDIGGHGGLPESSEGRHR